MWLWLLSFIRWFTGRFRRKSTAHPAAMPAKVLRQPRRKAGQLESAPFDLVPLLSEKSVRLQELRTVAFRVPAGATKQQVARAVRARYKVSPQAVRIIVMPRKVRRRGRTQGRTVWWKKAYVRVEDVSALGIQP